MRSLERTPLPAVTPKVEAPQQYELLDYLAWRRARQQARDAHPCVNGCGKPVSGNKVYCLRCWELVNSQPEQVAA